jgi:predicted dehydrogenase
MADHDPEDRRRFLKAAAGIAAASAAPLGLARPVAAQAAAPDAAVASRIRFGVIGINHDHIHGQITALRRGGGELVSFYAKEDDLAADFQKRYPEAKRVNDERAILEDATLKLVASSGIPNEREPLGVRVMRHGKDYMVDKPGITSLEQFDEARRVQKETGRIYFIMYSERFENRAVVRAHRLVKDGAIGRVFHVVGQGPHREKPQTRPSWFWDTKYYGGILCDIASHQADHFLSFTGSTRGDVVAARVANLRHPDQPNFEDFGDILWQGDGGTGYVRVDWFTPAGLFSPDGDAPFGDGRITVVGTDGYIEIRSNVDIAGRKGKEHLFLVDKKETRHVDCSDEPLVAGARLVDDVLNRTETAMPQAHCFLAAEMVLKAQALANKSKTHGGRA